MVMRESQKLKTQAKQTIDQLTHLNADQIASAKQNIDQATKLQPIAELVDQATQLNQSMDPITTSGQ